ncbi:MAG: PilZ domain-containing protein [Desulfuromonadales bacterium]|nr:PilZ domain-containing protein [Desulfuromonadales bacterium]
MSDAHHPRVDTNKYFSHKQKAYLINVSKNRDHERYESLSGTIVGRSGNSIALQIPYSTEYASPGKPQKHTFKLTTETMGNGIQVIADLVRIESGNIFHLNVCSNIEMYQRHRVPRIDTTIKLFQIQNKSSLAVYSSEFSSFTEQMKSRGAPPNLTLQEATINLGVGGIRVATETKVIPSQLSLFFIGINDNDTPVCALGELVWEYFEKDMRMCGYRFIQISKVDQERIRGFIHSLWKKQKRAVPQTRVNWELVDRMMYDQALE